MSLRLHWALLISCSVCLALVAPGCPKDEEPAPEPSPPSYPPADIPNLISHDGGTGGGPNMGTFTMAVFDADDATVPPAMIFGATVLVWHGGGTLVQQTTHSNGQAVFTDLTPGALNVTVVASGFVNISLVDINAATAALGMSRRYIKVSGAINASAAANNIEVELLTKEFDAFEGKALEKYGRVTSLQRQSGAAWSYELWLRGGVTEDMVVRELDSATGRVLHREVRSVVQSGSPPWNNLTRDFTFTSGTTTGLHYVRFGVQGVHTDAKKVVAWYEENYVTYRSYSSVGSVPGTWSVELQMPPNKTNARIVIDTYTSDEADASPAESWDHTYNSGPADNSVATVSSFTESFVTFSGNFLNPIGLTDIFLVEARYSSRSHLAFGVVSWTGDDYAIRAPSNLAVDFRILELRDPGNGSMGTLVGHKTVTVAGAAADTVQHFDMALSAALAIDASAPVPAGIPNPTCFAALTGPYPSSSKFLAFPFLVPGTASAGSLSIPMRYGPIPGVTFIFIAIAQETGSSGSAAQSFYIRGNLADPLTTMGASPSLPLADVATVHSPADGAILSRNALTFAWTGDTDAANSGLFMFDIRDADEQKVWSVVTRGSVHQAVLTELPTGLNSYNLVSGATYTFQIATVLKAGVDFDSYLVDAFPEDLESMASSSDIIRSTTSREIQFTLTP